MPFLIIYLVSMVLPIVTVLLVDRMEEDHSPTWEFTRISVIRFSLIPIMNTVIATGLVAIIIRNLIRK